MTKSDRAGYKIEVGLEVGVLTLLGIEIEWTVLELDVKEIVRNSFTSTIKSEL